ncbi:MAG: hypothetical protein PUC82_00390 [bacterium]|nr:hypothetical protein [bacterium]
MKKFKLNNKGFMLVETLVVTVFVMAIFSIIYTNLYPIMAEYEKREVYDDVDGKYGIYWMKKIIQSNDVDFGNSSTPGSISYDIINNKYHRFDCDSDILYDATARNLCKNLVDKLQIAKRDDAGNEISTGKPCIYITSYMLTDFKEKASNEDGNGIFSGGLSDYVAHLPEYKNIASLNYAKYRVIVEYHRTKDDNNYYAYSTIEVKK